MRIFKLKDYTMKKILFYILIAIVSVSCVKEPIAPDQPTGLLGKIDVIFTLETEKESEVGTRAFTDTDIENVDLLIFDQSNNFIERIKIPSTDITGTGLNKTFKARLDVSNDARTIYVIANARDATTDADRVNFGTIAPGASHTTVIPGLQTTILGDNMLPLVMWGRRTVTSITSSTTVSALKLLRAVASVEVRRATGLTTAFVINSYTLEDASAVGRVAPSAYTSEAATPTAPYAITGTTDYRSLSPAYWATWSATPGSVVYAYDRTSTTSDYPAVIIRATYSGTDGYYKVEMVNSSGTPYNIIRNHRYIVTITDVNGPGYANITDAVSNPPANIRASIIDQRGDIAIIVADGANELGISNNMVILQGTNTGSKDIAKVYSSRNSNAAPTITRSGVVATATLSALGTDNVRTLSATCSGVGTGTITLTSGTLTLTINVTVRAITGDATASGTLYYLTVLTNANKPWQIDIASGSSYVWLHPNTSPATYPGGAATSWGLTHMRSNNFGTAFIYFSSTAAIGTVKYTYLSGTDQNITWLVMNR